MEELKHDFINGDGDCPDDTTEAYNVLFNYKKSYNPSTILVEGSEEVPLSNVGGIKGKYSSCKSGGGGRERNVQCYFCGKLGHIVR